MAMEKTSADGAQCFAYLFEAKGVQRYIFDSGRLRDLIGASDLVAGIAESPRAASDAEAASAMVRDVDADLVGKVLMTLGCKLGEVTFSRRAGGAFCLHAGDREALDRFRAVFRVIVGLKCPGLEYSDSGPVEATDDIAALNDAYKSGTAVRDNGIAELLPAGHTYTLFVRRTGRIAVAKKRYGTDEEEIDSVIARQRAVADALATEFQKCKRLDHVSRRFLDDAAQSKYVFPRNLDPDEPDEPHNPQFPFLKGTRRIAVIHADLSGLGEIFQSVTDPKRAKSTAQVREIATGIELALEKAARQASAKVLYPEDAIQKSIGERIVLPARPIVLGGDDITILVRADLAIPYARELLKGIEEHTRNLPYRSNFGMPEYLTACAGIAIVKAGQPFLMAYALAESLCAFAKGIAKKAKTAVGASAKPYASLLAFHNAQSTLQEDYDDLLERELTTLAGAGEQFRLTAGPYLVGKPPNDVTDPGWRKLDDLWCLGGALGEARAGRGKLLDMRRMLLDGDKEDASWTWQRWCDVWSTREPADARGKKVLDALKEFNVETTPIAGTIPMPVFNREPVPDSGASRYRHCPIFDALELIDLGTFIEPSSKVLEAS